jgi:hypothetical protein
MTSETNDAVKLDERLFDRLADGELDEPGRRALLSRLDEIPGGWRLCALAFLEAQAWRGEMRLVAGRSGADVPSCENAARGDRRRRARRAGLMASAIVAAFVGGWLVRTDRGVFHDGPEDLAAKATVPRDADAAKSADDAASEPQLARPELPPGIRLAGVLTFQIDKSGQPREVHVPVLEGPGIDSRWLLEQPPTVRDSIVKELKRRGNKVEAHRQLLTVNLKDGRKVILPFDQVDVRFANRVYQ